jgi:hypothetical protein
MSGTDPACTVRQGGEAFFWELMSVNDGTSGRGDISAGRLRHALLAGWEPFAVSNGFIWLKRKAALEAAPCKDAERTDG